MMDVKPWEPVTLRYVENEQENNEKPIDWPWGKEDFKWLRTEEGCIQWLPALVVLANGQRIIVRPLSEERKAARRARQGAK